MKLRFVAFLVLVVCAAMAQAPSVRLGRLRDCDVCVIKPTSGDPFTLYGKPRVRELLGFIRIESDAVRGSNGGRELYRLTFYRGADKKPVDILWVREGGVWGFNGSRYPYGQNDKLIPWIEKAKG